MRSRTGKKRSRGRRALGILKLFSNLKDPFDEIERMQRKIISDFGNFNGFGGFGGFGGFENDIFSHDPFFGNLIIKLCFIFLII